MEPNPSNKPNDQPSDQPRPATQTQNSNAPQGERQQGQNRNNNQRGRGNGGGNRNPQNNGPRPAGAEGQNPQQPRPPRENGVSNAVSRQRRRIAQQGPQHTDLLPSLDFMPVNKSLFNGAAGTQQAKKGAQNRGPANQLSREPKLRIIPLGGLGEVGKNMMAIEYGDDIITVDMGFMFPNPTKQPGVDYMIPDVTYLIKNKHKIRGHILSHAHEDHMGGIPFILPQLPAPIFTARFSAGMVEKKLVEYHLQTQPQIRVLDPDIHERVQLGVFNIELVRVTHAIPDACAVVISTPVGKIINTGDWRFDPTPVDNKVADKPRLEELGREGVLLLMGDSTSCELPGRSMSEMAIADSFDDVFGRAEGRIILASFSSQINRIQLVIDSTARAGRKIAFVGRSMLANVELAVKLGYLKVPAGIVMKVQEIVNQPDNKVVVMCTGSQGEENSALTRMGNGEHQNIKIKAGDSIIFSSSIIPGNDRSVTSSMDGLMREGARVYHHIFRDLDHVGPLHVGGHGHREEVIEMVQLVKPKFFVPIHGEFHMLVRNAEAAIEAGIPQSNVFVMDNGDVLELTADSAAKAPRVQAGIVMIDGAGIGDVEGVVLRDRVALASEGVFMIIATVSRKTGKLISSPDIISRGFIYMKDNEDLINKTRAEVRRAFEKKSNTGPMTREDWTKFKLNLRDDVADYLYSQTKRNPMVLPVVNEV
ncbi:ribonuclease J [Candidatus Saccharibacteria bacterium]|nr:ribonuclease J [Candidatus Saccharibacteria bacterium]